MTWMHCLNCGWQGENHSGKSEKIGGMVLVVAGAAALVLGKLPIGIGLIVVGAIVFLVGMGSGASLVCPHCQSSDIKKFKHSLQDKGAGSVDPGPGP